MPKPITETALSGLPDKCCMNCAHGRPYFEQAVLKQMVICKAGPPNICVVPTPQGPGFQAKWPSLDPHQECDTFAVRLEKPSENS
jgi:hypothetical protein